MFPSFFFGKLDVDVFPLAGNPRVHRGWNLLPHPFLTSRTVGMWSQWDGLKLGSLGCCKGMAAEMVSIDMTERFAKIILPHCFLVQHIVVSTVFKVSLALKKTCGGWSWSKQELDSTPRHTPRCFGTWIVIIYCCVLSSVIVLVKSLWTKWDLNVSWNIFEVASKPIPLNIVSPLDSL